MSSVQGHKLQYRSNELQPHVPQSTQLELESSPLMTQYAVSLLSMHSPRTWSKIVLFRSDVADDWLQASRDTVTQFVHAAIGGVRTV